MHKDTVLSQSAYGGCHAWDTVGEYKWTAKGAMRHNFPPFRHCLRFPLSTPPTHQTENSAYNHV